MVVVVVVVIAAAAAVAHGTLICFINRSLRHCSVPVTYLVPWQLKPLPTRRRCLQRECIGEKFLVELAAHTAVLRAHRPAGPTTASYYTL